MSEYTNRRIVLEKRPEGVPTPDCFRLEEVPVGPLGEGDVLIRSECLSIDAFIRTTFGEDAFHGTAALGSTVTALGVGRVLESANPDFAPGDGVSAPLGAQTHALLPAAMAGMIQKVDEKRVPLRTYLGALGMTTGLTAYFGIIDVGLVKEGDTVIVSGAAGAVGSIAAQIAKIKGAKVFGVAGGPDKVRFLVDELGLDGGIDYKNEDVGKRLDEVAPNGIDVFFDNVGGELLDLVLDRIAERARVVICGAISQYSDTMSKGVRGPSLYLRLAERYARMEGFTVMHFMAGFPQAVEDITGWLESGQLKMREDVAVGIENFPEALMAIFTGGNTGKQLVDLT
jgi:NADPH-dependent curcumin reductase CurA